MYCKKQGFRLRTCLPGGSLSCKAGRVLLFPFSRESIFSEQTRCRRRSPLNLAEESLFSYIPHRAKNLIKIGLLALFFCPLVCQNIRRRIFL